MTRQILLILTLSLLPLTLFAQGTTSGSIEGTITDETGESLPGANIIAVHQPTGTEYGTSSRVDGGYTIRNVRVGGPYEVRVTFIGFNPQIKEVGNIELGERVSLDFQLEEGSLELGQISVTAVPDQIFNSDRTGASKNISTEQISRTPTVSRSLSDFTRLTPQVTSGNSFGGANDRYNNILVDGATLNDVFGLGDATPGSQAGVSSPLSIDAIAEFNVDIAPFDVTNNGFTGGQVNAITKSGTNTYEGSVYFQTRNESLVGNYIGEDGETANEFPEFSERYIGLNIGGPIIQNKLFFFVNAEFRRETQPITAGISGSGAPNTIDFSASTFDEISNVFQSEYGYNTGAYTSPIDVAQDNNKVLAKLDWNINQSNKLTFRYNHVDAVDEEGVGRGTRSYSYSNRQYNFNSNQDSFVAQLNSTIGNNVYNEARVVYTRIRDSRDVVAERFPEVEVSLPFETQSGFGSIFAGIDRFSQANSLDQDLIEITNNLTYIRGNHELTFGTNNQIFTFDNTFVQDAFGTYEFRSIDDLEAGTPYAYQYSYLLPGGSPTANFTGMQFGAYVQDKWTLNPDLKITYGLRVDIPVLPDDPTSNPLVPNAFPGYSTENVASGNILWSPRFGFNWDLSGGERTTQLRGGAGIFSGTPPFVWISNQYSNTGVDYGRVDVSGSRVPDDLRFSPDPDNQPSPLDPNSALSGENTSEINLISEDFKYPQSLKVNLALDQQLPLGFVGTIEGVYSSGVNDVVFENLNIVQQGQSAYGRPIYGDIVFNERFGNASGFPSRKDENFTNALLLKNSSEAYQYSITGTLEKQFDNGLNTSLSYTYNRAVTENNGTSSRAISNWQFNENVDVNNPKPGTADFERRHRILGVVSYQFSWLDRMATTISLIYDGRSGSPYSWIYNGDANGDGRFDNDLIYVPENENEVVLTSNNWGEFDGWISSKESLSDYRGDFVDRGTAREPWTNYLDLQLTQQVETFSGQSIEFSASMFNVLNFLNEEWGIRKGVSFNNYRAFDFQQYVNQDFIDNNPEYGLSSGDIGKPVVNFDPENVTEERLYSISDLSSRWQMQFSVRYNF
ncbi:MAG: carboxypeptidase regulatory-like domain-containing protein [Balneolaceae bacterium]|nr:carboxypeptidase regulatory-like domain-containing protein [Balneolaceae bacterium]